MSQFPDSELFRGDDARDKKTRQAHYRIEALRAASRIVAGCTGKTRTADGFHDLEDNTLELAEQFALWLETGER